MFSRAVLKINGYVQGVGFRYFVIDQASALGVNGYARNASDGGVEVVAEGQKDSIEQLIKILKVGASGSSVSEVKVNYENYLGEFNDFRIKY